ncbi:MAG: tyrosine-type recombinase/integrase [Aeoliella sp.]
MARWVADKRELFSEKSGATDGVLSIEAARGESLPIDAPLFDVPRQLVKILDRDLAAAGIVKRYDRGRTVDFHALRHTYGSLLSADGVAPRTSQAAMRHSSIDLTMNVYTDPRVLDVAGALDSRPAFPLDDQPPERQRNIATGTDDHRTAAASPLTPTLAPD